MSGLHEELAVLHDEKRSADPASVRVDPDLSVPNVPDHGYLSVNNVHLSPQFSECCHKLFRIPVIDVLNTRPAIPLNIGSFGWMEEL